MAAVLFTDMVGSTELLSRLGEVVFDDLRRAHFTLLRNAISETGGEDLKTLGDGILAVFGSATDALDCAMAMQQAVDRRSRSGPAPVAVRAGLAVGDVSFEEGDVFGTPVVEAARLVSAARGGQILATAVVRAVAGGRSGARFSDLGKLALKGLPEPVAICDVAWEPLPTAPAPLPTLLTEVGRIFVARHRELDRLGELLSEAAAGDLRVALIAGEPGVGKTRLAAELAGRAHAEGALVVAGRCDEDMGVPYQPFVEALRHFTDHTPDGDLSDRLGCHRSELLRLVPELTERLPELPAPLRSDPDTERFRLFDAVADWLTVVSQDRPSLLVLDDLQWAAKPTLLLLRHVIRSSRRMRLLIIGTYRDTELGETHPLVELRADLRPQAGVERFTLSGLDRAGVAALMEQSAGHDLDEDDLALARAIWAETEGNPFFVREVLRHLADVGAVENREGRWATRLPLNEIGIPEGVREVVGRRLSRLSKEANRALRIAAVVGPEFELPVIQVAGCLDEEELLSSLEEAIHARLVMEVPGLTSRHRFAHVLVRDTLYRELSSARRLSLHRQVAEAIETVHANRLDDLLPALAHHYSAAAGSGSSAKAMDYARRAGDQAMAQLAFETAAAQYEQALRCLDSATGTPADGDVRCAVLLRLGEAQVRCGDARARATYLSAADLARAREDAESLTRAAFGIADIPEWTGRVNWTNVHLLEEVIDALGEQPTALRAVALGRLASMLYYAPSSFERREALSAEAVSIARRLGDPLALAACLHTRNSALWTAGGALQRLAAGREIALLAEAGGDLELALSGHAWCQTALLELGDMAAFDTELDAYDKIAECLGQARYRWYAHSRRAMRALLTGDLDTGERLAREALALGGECANPDAMDVFLSQMWVVCQERPNAEARELFAVQARLRQEQLGADNVVTLAYRAGIAALQEPSNQESRTEIATCLASLTANGLQFLHALVIAGVLAAPVARLGDRNGAMILYDLLLPLAGTNCQVTGSVVFLGAYDYHLGLLATALQRWEDAERHFGRAAAVHERLGARAYLARTWLEWARMLAARRRLEDGERIRELLLLTLARARELGLTNVERRAVALLDQLS
jgi:class 3 adenylate cyclase